MHIAFDCVSKAHIQMNPNRMQMLFLSVTLTVSSVDKESIRTTRETTLEPLCQQMINRSTRGQMYTIQDSLFHICLYDNHLILN